MVYIIQTINCKSRRQKFSDRKRLLILLKYRKALIWASLIYSGVHNDHMEIQSDFKFDVEERIKRQETGNFFFFLSHNNTYTCIDKFSIQAWS